MYSELTESELEKAPSQIKEFVKSLPEKSIEYIEITEESIVLADRYIGDNIVGKTSREDCIHIALATINRADVLISWNFKHIVNYKKIPLYNAVNILHGYEKIDVYSPLEIINDEN